MRETANLDRLRSLLLTAMLLCSAVAGTAAITGAAAGQADGTILSAVEYTDGNGSDIEVVLDRPLEGNEDVVVRSGGVRAVDEKYDGQTITANLSGDVDPTQNLSIAVVSDGTTVDTATDVDVTVTSINENSDVDERVYTGEPIAIVADQKNEDVVVRNDQLVLSSSTGPHSQVFVLDTDDLESDDTYTVEFRGEGDGADTERFTLTDLRLNATAESTSLFTEEHLTATATVQRGGVDAEATLVDASGETVETITKRLSAARETTFDFGPTAAGDYTVKVTDAHTGTDATTDTIAVTKRGPAAVTIAPSTVEEHRGDVATIALNATNTERAAIRIGGSSDGYWLHANVTDENDDDRIVLQFNTYTAGNDYASNDTDLPASEIIWSESDAISDVSQGGAYVDAGHDVGADTIDRGSYALAVGGAHAPRGDLERTGVGSLTVRERETENLTVHVAPASTDFAGLSAAEVRAGLGSTVTFADEIADEDVVVHELDASGLEGVAAYRGGPTEMVLHGWVDLSIAPTTAEKNVATSELELDGANTAVVADADNDTYYLAVETGGVDVANGQTYNSTVDTVGTMATGPAVADEWTKVATTASIDTNASGVVLVESAPNQTVSGSTNLAPGTEVTLTIESSDAENPFLLNPTTTVGPNGTITATTDGLADVEVGTEFTVALQHGSDTLATADGRVVEATNGTTASNGTTTATPDGGPAAGPNATATPTPTPTPASTTTSGAGPGFGVAAALVALIGATLLASRRSD